MTNAPDGTRPDSGLAVVLREMLESPEYLLPLVAAGQQFRRHYYGLNSAALLEDLFFDAVVNFVNQHHPGVKVLRAGSGQRGWDYAVGGTRYSHKVNQDLSDVSVYWDATREDAGQWSAEDAIVLMLERNAPSKSVTVSGDGFESLRCSALDPSSLHGVTRGRALVLAHWRVESVPSRILSAFHSSTTPLEPPSFRDVWNVFSAARRQGARFNELEMLVTTRRLTAAEARDFGTLPPEGVLCEISAPTRAGCYLIGAGEMQGIVTKKNNRGVLIPKNTMRALLDATATAGNFVPIPHWYTYYASERPPDLYLSQRMEFDELFSGRIREN